MIGVMYDTLAFSWWLREDKLAVIIEMLMEMEEADSLTMRFLKWLEKLVHYRLIVCDGKFHLGQLSTASITRGEESLDSVVTLSN